MTSWSIKIKYPSLICQVKFLCGVMSLLNQNNSKEVRTPRRAKSVAKDVIDFTKVGGLNHHLKTLREIIIFPLLHANVFSHFKIKPPRGVLFYGPPGTGKTLVAGALASEINREGIGKVSFFQRKGADILDKWVGESEKNLRNLFEKATKSRPSIIFFDELDGLAPCRSEKNDHVHCSIVATLLALMDGLDTKPGVIVIGATNRIEAIDPALRRAGRFDKELYFPLPGVEARKEIIQVHTSTWKHKPSPKFLAHLADITAGYCGSDIQALCSEAVLCCLRRNYPKIDSKGQNIDIKLDDLKVEDDDFLEARLNLTLLTNKNSHRWRDLSPVLKPLLTRQQNRILRYIQLLWPHFLHERYKYKMGEERYAGRILLIGSNMQGLNSHLIPSILKNLEHIPIFVYDTRLFDRIRSSILNVQNNYPAVILLSRIDEWWSCIDDCDKHSVVTTLEEIHAGLPILTVASCKTDIPPRLQNFFYNNSTILIRIEDPNEEEREHFLAPLFYDDKSLSLYNVWEKTRRNCRRVVKCEVEDVDESFSKRKRKKTKSEDDGDDSPRVISPNKRKKELGHCSKKMKICASNQKLFTSSSCGRLYHCNKIIKREKGDDGEFSDSTSDTSIQVLNQKQYFTRVLSDLLNQRHTISLKSCSSSISEIEDQLCSDIYKLDSKAKTSLLVTSRKNLDEHNTRTIYNLWKYASSVTSKNMTVAQLELLYDVISACISIHQRSFEVCVEHLENVLKNVENSYQITSE